MREQLDQAGALHQDDARGAGAPSALSSSLGAIIDELAGAGPAARRRSAQALNQALRMVRRGPDGEAVARRLLSALEARALDGLEDDEGAACRSEAVAALLRLGYPWALHLDPEDLAFHRATHGRGRRRRRLLVAALVAAVLALGAGAYVVAVPRSPPEEQCLSGQGPPRDVQPTLVEEAVASYPLEAARDRVEGDVELRVDLDDSGTPVRVVVLSGPGHGLDEAAQEAIGRSRFSAGMKDGKAVPSSLLYTYRWRLSR